MADAGKPSGNSIYELEISASYKIHSTHPIEPCDLRGAPCSLLLFRAIMAREVAARRDVSKLQPLLDAWNAHPGLILSQVIDLLEA